MKSNTVVYCTVTVGKNYTITSIQDTFLQNIFTALLYLFLPSGSSSRVTPSCFSATEKACSRFSMLVCRYTFDMSISLGLR